MIFIAPIQVLAILALLIVFVPIVGPVVLPFAFIAFVAYVVYDNIRYRRKKRVSQEEPMITRSHNGDEIVGANVHSKLTSVQATEKALRIIEIRDLMVLLEHDLPDLDLVTQTETDRITGIRTVTITGAAHQPGQVHVCKVRFDKDGIQLGEPTCALSSS